jgi:anthranilate phosphoribosyltransferase
LRPVDDPAKLVPHFLDVVSGAAGEVATHTVALNAAALAIAGGHFEGWGPALAAAQLAIHDGAARDLVERVRTAPRPAQRVPAPRTTSPRAASHG